MSKPRPGKSGSVNTRFNKKRTKRVLSTEATAQVMHALTIANRYNPGSDLKFYTLTECVKRLITEHGCDISFEILSLPIRDPSQRESLRLSVCCALSHLGDLNTVRILMRESGLQSCERASTYHIMACYLKKHPMKEAILEELRRFAQATTAETTRIYLEASIFYHTRQPDDPLPPRLVEFVATWENGRVPETSLEMYTLLQVAGTISSCEIFVTACKAIDRIPESELKSYSLHLIFGRCRLLAKEHLLELADALAGSPYEPLVRDIAADARSIEDIDTFENEL